MKISGIYHGMLKRNKTENTNEMEWKCNGNKDERE